MRARQVLRPLAYQQLADDLRTEIVSGRLRPGDRLPTEPQLCHTWGLSRSTVREALRLLASQHLITTTRGVTGGSFVAQPNPAAFAESLSTGLQMMLSTGPADIRAVLDARAIIDPSLAALAALRANADDLAALNAALFDPNHTDLDTVLTATRAFHRALVAAVHNPVFSLLVQPLYEVANERDLVSNVPGGYWERVDHEHRTVLDALIRRDADAAHRAAAAHVDHLLGAYS